MKFVVIPWYGHTFEQMFARYSPFFRDGVLEYTAYMFKKCCENSGIEILPFSETAVQECDAILHFDTLRKDVLRKYNTKCHLYIASEPAIVTKANSDSRLRKLSKYVYDAVVTTHAPIDANNIYQFLWPRDFPVTAIPKVEDSFHEKKLACMFAGNKYALGKHEQYSIRRDIVHYFEKHSADDFDLYGRGWDGPYKKFRVYRGPSDDLLETSSHYKFSFCLENERFVKSNITEKIFDTMIAGTVPVYEGMDDIEDFVPADCFIRYGKFAAIEDCVEYLRNMPEKEYMQYKKNIERYILSDETRKKFSAENMRDQIVRACQEQTVPKKHRALWLLDIYWLEQKIYNLLCRLQKYYDYITLKIR